MGDNGGGEAVRIMVSEIWVLSGHMWLGRRENDFFGRRLSVVTWWLEVSFSSDFTVCEENPGDKN